LASAAALTDQAISEFAHLASEKQFARTAVALERNGMTTAVADSGSEARSTVGALLPHGAEVFNNTSGTLETIGVAEDIERSGRYQPLRLRLYQMDREMQRREMRILASSPDYVVGSAHAVTEKGSLLIASASGSQLGPIVFGAERVILVIAARRSSPTPKRAFGASTSTASRWRTLVPVGPTACRAESTTSS
jgi:hypothetical protein